MMIPKCSAAIAHRTTDKLATRQLAAASDHAGTRLCTARKHRDLDGVANRERAPVPAIEGELG